MYAFSSKSSSVSEFIGILCFISLQTMNIKITICRILRNTSLELATAETLCEREELNDVITSLLINADYATELFYEVVQFVHALITILQARGGGGHNQNLNKLMKNLNERNLFDRYRNNSTPVRRGAVIIPMPTQ